jgi:hypothetical protein
VAFPCALTCSFWFFVKYLGKKPIGFDFALSGLLPQGTPSFIPQISIRFLHPAGKRGMVG